MHYIENEYKSLQDNFKSNFKNFLGSLPIKRAELAKLLGIHRATIYYSLNDESTFSWELMVKISILIPNFSIDSIRYGTTSYFSPQKPRTKKLIEYITNELHLQVKQVSKDTGLSESYVRAILFHGFEPNDESLDLFMKNYGGFVAYTK